MTREEITKPKATQNRYRRIYDGVISKFYDRSLKIGLSIFGERKLRMHLVDLLLPFINTNDIILDLCCGTGTLTTMLVNVVYSNCKIVGIDLSRGQILEANKKNHYSNLEFKVMNASDLIFASETFNIVIISAALHEMNKDLRSRVLNKVHRVLKK